MIRLGPDMVLTVERWCAFWAKVDTSAGPTKCWRWRGVHNPAKGTRRRHWNGNSRRPRFRVAGVPGTPTHMYVAPLMLMLHDPAIRTEVERLNLFACHRPGVCTNAWCINPLHLYWGTEADNVRDRYPMRRVRR